MDSKRFHKIVHSSIFYHCNKSKITQINKIPYEYTYSKKSIDDNN